MGKQNHPERDLIALLKAGDSAALTKVYLRHTPSMIRVAQSILHNRATAEEVTQETWLSVVKNIDGFEGRSPLAGWIFTILVNTARTRAKREGRTISFDDTRDEDGLASAFDGHGRWKDMPALWDEITPERIVAGRKLADHLNAAIDKLPDAQRAVIVMRVQHGLDNAEICKILGITNGNLRILLHRARLSLRATLDALQ